MRYRLLLPALALLLASCGGGDSVFGPGPTPAATPTSDGSSSATTAGPASTTEAPTTTNAATTSTTAAIASWAWSRPAADGSVFGGPEDQYAGAVAAGGPGLVAVGSDFAGGDFDAAVWTSADGMTWSRVPHDEAMLGGPGDQGMDGVVAGVAGLVAFGLEDAAGDDDVAVWTSPDGMTWSRVPHDEALFGGPDDQEARALAAVDPGFVMVGVDYSTGDGDTAVWTSPDGFAWSRVPTGEALGGPGDQLANAVTLSPAGLVAVGSEWITEEADGVVWTSADGSSWSRVPDAAGVFGGPGSQNLRAVVAAGGKLIAVGGDSAGGDVDFAVWTSDDGRTWSRVPHDEAVFGGPGDQRVLRMSVGGPGLIAAGVNDTGADRDGLVWVATPSG